MSLHYTSTKLTLPQVRTLIRSLPGVLCGRLPDTFNLRRAFVGAFVHHLYKLGHASFKARAYGESYRSFDPWAPLRDATIKRKSSPKLRGTLYDMPEAVNIRSGRLLDSFIPGEATADGYRPSSGDQQVVLRAGSVELRSLIEYAAKAFSGRPMWPDDMSDLVAEATQVATDALASRLKQVLHVR